MARKSCRSSGRTTIFLSSRKRRGKSRLVISCGMLGTPPRPCTWTAGTSRRSDSRQTRLNGSGSQAQTSSKAECLRHLRRSREQFVRVAVTAEHTDNDDSGFGRTIEDQVITDWKAAKARGKFFPRASEIRRARQHFANGVNLVEKLVGSGRAIVGNIKPDFDEVELGLARALNFRQRV